MSANRMSKIVLVIAIVGAALATIGLATSPKAPTVSAAAVPVDTSDFFLRHPDWITMYGSVNNEDYALRHPELNAAVPAVDTSDFFLRHPDWINMFGGVDTSDYALRHPGFTSLQP